MMNRQTLSPHARLWVWAAWGFLLVAAIGVTIRGREFATLSIGPLYSLEGLWLLWAACTGMVAYHSSELRSISHKAIRSVWPITLFFLWGLLRLMVDCIHNVHSPVPMPWQRVAQHSLLFIYPLVWGWAGAISEEEDAGFIRAFVGVVFVLNILPNFAGNPYRNLSLGPLLAVGLMFWLSRRKALQQRLNIANTQWIIGSILLYFFTFWPYWNMWLDVMQRTALVLLFVTVLLIPAVLTERSILKSVAIAITAIVILISGFFISPIVLYVRSHGFVSPSRLAIPSTSETQKPDVKAIATPVFTSSPIPIPQKTDGVPITTSQNSPPKPSFHQTVKDIKEIVQTQMTQSMTNSVQHGEDRPSAEDPRPFQVRTRRFMWRTALDDWEKQPILGIGYLPEVPSAISPTELNLAFFNGRPTSGPHNSYLSILARGGIIGFCIFGIAALHLGYSIFIVLKKERFALLSLILIMLIINGALHAAINVGFESPHNCMIFWFAWGALVMRAS